MSRLRRVVSMMTASSAVLALGFVVAVAARSTPGGDTEEAMMDLDLRADIDLGPFLAWVLTLLAVIGAVLLAMGLKQAQPRKDARRRNLLGAAIGLILFVLIVRWLRPAAESLLAEGSAAAESATDALDDIGTATGSGWLFSILLAAVLAAALTRIALSVNAAPFAIQGEDQAEARSERPAPVAVTPIPRSLGIDPRSRIINTYQEFESSLGAAGHARSVTETTGRHARRAAAELSLDPETVGGLVDRHALARYGRVDPSESDAEAAERSSSMLRERLRG